MSADYQAVIAKALRVPCCCGHSIGDDHQWTSGPGGLVRWCTKLGCDCTHSSSRRCLLTGHDGPLEKRDCQGGAPVWT